MEKKSKFASFLSGIYLLAACLILVGVCHYCYPDMGKQVKDAIAGFEGGSVRQAFGVLAEELESGSPISEAVGDSVQVLFDHAD